MSGTPNGRLEGADLVVTRTFRAGIEDVWASVTDPVRTARWFGAWVGDAAPGRTIKVQMAYEEGRPWTDARIDACDPPRRLAVTTADDAGAWRLELLLSESAGRTELRLVHHLTSAEGLGEIGPGWEYYLDMLVAAHDGTARPDFGAYYPAMRDYYASLGRA